MVCDVRILSDLCSDIINFIYQDAVIACFGESSFDFYVHGLVTRLLFSDKNFYLFIDKVLSQEFHNKEKYI